MIKAKVAFLEGRLLSSQLEQSDKFSKSPDWLEKSRPCKKATFVLIMQTGYKSHFEKYAFLYHILVFFS